MGDSASVPGRVRIFDTTLRDGEQAPGFSLGVDGKLLMALQLQALGADVVEAGFPIASDTDAEAVRLIASTLTGPSVAALARAADDDIDRAAWALQPAVRPRIHVFIATSDLHLARKLRMTRAECLEAAARGVARARRYVADVQFSAEDATRSDRAFLCEVIEAVVDAGATTINLPDTVGYSTPDEIAHFFDDIIARCGRRDDVAYSAHCHDDLGLAVANSLAALSAGARQVECTINGIGERAGNASLEEVVMAMAVRPDRLPYRNGIDTRQLYPSSQLLTQLTGEHVQANKAIVGRNAFAHEAGIHQDGMLKDRRTYEIMRPEDVGVPGATLVLGKHSGRHAVARRCEQLGLALGRREVDRVYRAMIALADKIKIVGDADLRAIAERECGQAAAAMQADPYAAIVERGYGHGV
ncbi:MAG TPA: 2-isopropylmalate synthase [Vicinamibacterales bacterium]|nr:2-isopropylmalate synthase [Vicinamibacterales bacterium]